MGYTHYWRLKFRHLATPEEEAAYSNAIVKVAEIVRHSPVDIGDAHGEGTPQLSDQAIAFNGRSNDNDDSHESFYLLTRLPAIEDVDVWLREHHRNDTRDFNFTKTAYKPYDVVVVACLAALEHYSPGVVEVSSDGGASDWLDGLELAQRVLDDPTIDLPRIIAGREVVEA